MNFFPLQRLSSRRQGFTLLELSIVLIIIGLVTGMALTSGIAVIASARLSATQKKLAAIDQALMSFRAANDRIPCPASLVLPPSNSSYGFEATDWGACTGASWSASINNFTAAGVTNTSATAAEGAVPTATLGLPNDFMYDGWGNRFRYGVDVAATRSAAFAAFQPGCLGGAITVYDSSGTSTRSTAAIYALVSHGPNGYGAYTLAGSSTPVNAGSQNLNEQTNCHCSSTGAAGTYSPTYVQADPYYQSGHAGQTLYYFDDVVSYKERWQMQIPTAVPGTACPYTYSRAITIDHTKVSAGTGTSGSTLSNFPFFFTATYADLKTAANSGSVQSSYGYDIGFSSSPTCTPLLPFEQESYSASSGQIAYWVKIPTLLGSVQTGTAQNTTIYICYGSVYSTPAATAFPVTASSVWDSNYLGVWHLNSTNGTTVSVADSTTLNSSTSNGTTSIAVTAGVSGVSATAAKFTNSYSNDISTSNSFYYPLNYTNEVWVNTTSITGTPAVGFESQQSGPDSSSYVTYDGQLYVDTAGYARAVCYNGSFFQNVNSQTSASPIQISNGSWYSLASTLNIATNPPTLTLYVNGVSQGTVSCSSIASLTGAWFRIGSYGGTSGPSEAGGYFNGSLDEVRFSKTVRSPDWIATEYYNQSAPDKATYGSSGFYTVGSATAVTR